MSRSVYGREQMAGGIPLFLMDIEWGGRTWRFSEFPVVIPSDIGDLQYTGGLEQFDYKESANFIVKFGEGQVCDSLQGHNKQTPKQPPQAANMF